ncbi:hypothetical protein PG997_011802 [Apiospora hydei]|uniref:Uncharacterized protein n=1 Tax=Apiospora hydei TaxID=1337664 RepID=A0ABR1V1J7_9PEZI
MPHATQISQYSHVPETKEDLDWADLANIDLSTYGTDEGNAALAQQLIEAVRTKGFFYVTNFGIPQEKVDRQFALGQAFYELPLEEKLKYVPDLDNGEYNGQRWPHHPARARLTEGAHRRDRNICRVPLRKSPRPPQPPHRPRPRAAPDFFTKLHRWDTHDESHLRYMKYGKFSPDEIAKLDDGLWSGGHTDLGTITLLFRQPVAALQIREHETGQWKWAKPLDGSLTVNTCDALSFLTGGYIKSTIHRVALPPADQRHVDRLGLLYFSRPQNDVVLKTIDSPVLQRAGFTQNEFEAGGHPVPTMGEFTQRKQKWQQAKAKDHQYAKDGEEIVPGFKGQYFK